MAPKESYKVHSLSKHIEDANKGLSAGGKYSHKSANRNAIMSKKAAAKSDANDMFGGSDSDEDANSDSSSDSDGGPDSNEFLKRPGSISKVGSNATGKKTKSNPKVDEIADSDEERRAAKPKTKSAKLVVETESEDEESSSGESNSGSDDTPSKPNPNRTKKSAAQSSGDSISSESDSEDDSSSTSSTSSGESQDGAPVKIAASNKVSDESSDTSSDDGSGSTSEGESAKVISNTKLNGKKPESDPGSSDSEEEDSDSDAPTQNSKPTPGSNSKKPVSSTSSDGSDSSGSESESDSGEEVADESMHISDRDAGNELGVPKYISSDFVLRKNEDGANGRDVAQVCNQANMEGKQFWYFTLPSNIPISVVQNLEIPMNATPQGQSTFSHAGEEYDISFDKMTPKSSFQILIPSASNTQYRSSAQQVDQIMQVKKITQLGLPSTSTSHIGPAKKRSPRPQPKGLKARFQPIGVHTAMGKIGVDVHSDDDGDVEMDEAPEIADSTPAQSTKNGKKSKAAISTETPAHSKKTNKSDAAKAPASQTHLKRKLTPSDDEAMAASQQLVEESQKAETTSKKQKTNRAVSPELGAEPTPNRKRNPVQPPASTPASTLKKSKKAKELNPNGTDYAATKTTVVPSAGKKETPVPVPRQTAVPVPVIPLSLQLPSSPTGAMTPADKKNKKTKSKPGANPVSARKETPVPPPTINGRG